MFHLHLVSVSPVYRTAKDQELNTTATTRDRTSVAVAAPSGYHQLPVGPNSSRIKTAERPVAVGCNQSLLVPILDIQLDIQCTLRMKHNGTNVLTMSEHPERY